MARPAALVVVLAVAAAFASPLAFAAAPRAEWRTIVTPRFRLHYHEGLAPLAARLAPIAEDTLDRLSELLASAPSTPIHVILTDETDSANGFALVLPENQINLYCGVPEAFGSLGDYDDYMTLLLTHEMTHVVHLDTIGGVARGVNAVLGKTIAPNHIQPRWFIEGLAVFMESKTTTGGRVRSSLVDMFVREQILADRFWTLDEITTQTRRFPGGGVAWDIGGRFLDFIARRHGVNALAQISNEYGSRIVPYGLNLIAKHATEKTYPELWDAWKQEQEEKTLAQLEKIQREGGVRAGQRLARPATEVFHPRFAADGSLAIVEAPRDGDNALVFLAPDLHTERLRLRTSRGIGVFTPDGTRYVASVTDAFEELYGYNDLELIELAGGSRRRRTHGARLDEPDVSPDGATIIAVAESGALTWLATLSIDGDDPPARFYTPPPGHQIAGPHYAPDGKTVVASLHTPDGGRRIITLDVATHARRDLTGSRSQDFDPVFSPDGTRVYFASDRGGIYNIYAVEVATRRIQKLTNVATGAFEPAIDPFGRVLAFVHGTIDGYDLDLLDLTAADPLPPDPPALRAAPTATVALSSFPEESYSPWESLLPKAYLPTTGLDGIGDTVGVFFSGQDAIAAHAYSANVEYGTASKRLNYAFSYYNRTMWMPLGLSTSLIATSRPASFPAAIPAEDRPESVFRARLSIDFPFSRWDSSYGFAFSYGIETHRGINVLPDDPVQTAPSVSARDLFLAAISLSWRFSNVRSFADSISPARGQAFDISADVHDPRLGSDLRLIAVSAHWAGFLELPWSHHHVLAARAAIGGSAGDARGRATYVLGGLAARNILRDFVDEVRVGADVIRGYEVAAFRGTAFYLTNLEYRVPLIAVERGVETFPFFVDRLHGAVFVDAGATPVERFELADTKVGAGAEVRLDLVLGYYLPVTARLGYAKGFAREGIDNVYLVLGGNF